ncbi:MAG: response regulator [Bacteroidota bacterium]
MKKLKCVLLIDDNSGDNRLHKILIEEMKIANQIHSVENGADALAFIKDSSKTLPDLIFLDINMPEMNGWDFLAEYKKLDRVKKANIVLIVLSGISNPDAINKAPEISQISNFELKPLTKRVLNDIIRNYF